MKTISRHARALTVATVLLLPASAHAAWSAANVSGSCAGMSFVDAQTGYAVVAGAAAATLKKTTNGTSWDTVAQTGLPQTAISGMQFIDASTGFVVRGSGGTTNADSLAKTTDGGATWSYKTISLAPNAVGTSTWLRNVRFGDKSNGVAVGIFALTRGFIAVTRDGGETWTEVAPPASTKSINNVLVLGPNHFVIAGGGTSQESGATVRYKIWNTRDGGATWEERYKGAAAGTNSFALDAVSGVLWANQGCAGPAAVENKCVLRSTDGGDTWDTTMNQYLGSDFKAMAFADATHGIIVGPKVFSTTNGGIDWTEETLPASSGPFGCAAYPGPNAYAGSGQLNGPAWVHNEAQGGGPRPPVGGTPDAADGGAPDGGAGGGADAGGGGTSSSGGSSSGAPSDGDGAGAGGDASGEGGGCAIGPTRTGAGRALASLGALAALVLGARRRKRSA